MNASRYVLLGSLFAAVACAGDIGGSAAPAEQTARPTPLPPPLGWQIWPITRSAMFTGAGPRETVYLTCSAKEPTRIYFWVPPNAPRSGKMTLMSGAVSTSLDMVHIEEDRATPPPTSADLGPVEALIIAADLPPRDPALSRFLETGELTLVWGSHELAADARPEQLPALRRNCA
jgi:hypothetical protein